MTVYDWFKAVPASSPFQAKFSNFMLFLQGITETSIYVISLSKYKRKELDKPSSLVNSVE